MIKRTFVIALAIATVALSGCSTRPRNFSAQITTQISDRTAFEADYRVCQNLVARGHTSNFKGAAASVLAGGGAFFGVGTVLYGAGAMGVSGGAAAVSAAVPVIGVLAGIGVSRAIRGGKERKFHRAMTSCLGEYGYSVESWTKLRKREDPAAYAASVARLAPAPAPANAPASPAPAEAMQDKNVIPGGK